MYTTDVVKAIMLFGMTVLWSILGKKEPGWISSNLTNVSMGQRNVITFHGLLWHLTKARILFYRSIWIFIKGKFIVAWLAGYLLFLNW